MAFSVKLMGAVETVIGEFFERFGQSGSGTLTTSDYPNKVSATGGAYTWGAVSGTMAAGLAAGSEIFQFRHSSASYTAPLHSVKFSASVAGTAFAAGVPNFSMTTARAWTVDGTGGTAIAFTGNTNKRRTDFATSSQTSGNTRISTTAALTAGTKTLDTNTGPVIVGMTGTATTGQIVPAGTVLWERTAGCKYPLLFEQNEGFVIRATVPATGTWAFAVTVEWEEPIPADF